MAEEGRLKNKLMNHSFIFVLILHVLKLHSKMSEHAFKLEVVFYLFSEINWWILLFASTDGSETGYFSQPMSERHEQVEIGLISGLQCYHVASLCDFDHEFVNIRRPFQLSK